jgi:hypothetical protein
MDTLNFAFSFLTTVRIHRKMFNILIPVQNVLFWKQDRLAFGPWRWCSFFVLKLCIDESVWKFSLIMDNDVHWRKYKFAQIRQNLYRLNKLLHKVLACGSAIILMLFFLYSQNLPTVVRVIQKNYSIFYNKMEVLTVNWFESVNFTDTYQWPNGITCSN